MSWAIFWGVFSWTFFACVLAPPLVKFLGIKKPWLVTLACWIWPATFLAALVVLPFTIWKKGSPDD